MAEKEYETAADELAAMMSGELQLEPAGDNSDDEDQDVTENDEDTDLEDATTSEDDIDDAETNDLNDGDDQDTEEDIDEDDESDTEENTPVEDSSLEEDEPTDEDGKSETEENQDTEEKDADPTQDTPEIDYKKQYEELLESSSKLQGFYDEVTADFKANGATVKGIKDPKKIVQNAQMSAGFSEKMSAFKPYRPFMTTIKDEGWLDDPSKFDMAVNLMRKDPEAIKSLIKESGLDPLEMDMDNVSYSGASHRASNSELVLDDTMASARTQGVESGLREALGGQWSEDGSLVELLENADDAHAFVGHLVQDSEGNSAYKDIMTRVGEKKRTDFSGGFGSKSGLTQYREAAAELQAEFEQRGRQASLDNVRAAQKAQADAVEAEKAKIAEIREAKNYKDKVAKESRKSNAARKKASSMSGSKNKTKAKKPKFDPIDKSHTLEGDALMDYFQKSVLGKG